MEFNSLIYLKTPLLTQRNTEGQGTGTNRSGREDRTCERLQLRQPLQLGPTRASPAGVLSPASALRGGVAHTRRHLGGHSRRSVYHSMVVRSRPAPPQSLSGGAAAAAAPSRYKPAVPGCEWITMYLSGKPIIINVTPRGSQW